MMGNYEKSKVRMVPASNGLIPRHDLHAEAALLNSVLTRGDAFDTVASMANPKHFYADENRFVMQACFDLAADGVDVNGSSVRGQLVDRAAMGEEQIDALMRRIDETPRAGNPMLTATRLRDLWVQREVCDTAHRIAAECYCDVGDVTSYVDQCASHLASLADTSATDTMVAFGEAVRESITAVADGATRDRGMTTGLTDYDARVCSFNGGELIVLGARPGMGKTAMGVQWAINEASRGNVAVIFSCEMRRGELAIRAICSRARIDGLKLKSNQCGPDDWRHLTAAATELAKLPLYIDDRSQLKPSDIRSGLKRLMSKLAAKPGPVPVLGCVVVDYLGLLDGAAAGPKANRQEQVAYCSRQLKSIAKEFNVPVIALAQLNRPMKGAKPSLPQLTDLRESGQIEADADNVTFIHRDEYYLVDKTPQELRGVAKLRIAKARSGAVGVVACQFFDFCTLFGDLPHGFRGDHDDE